MTKNIHLLPTQNNKSKLAIYHYNGSENIKIGELGLNLNNTVGWTNCWSEIELYITSDEEIEEPCWCWDILQNKIYWVHDTLPEYPTIGNYFKKIILTTDADLIKDGVQPIDDEFLKWFVKNPNCERVKIERVVVPDDNNYGSGEIFHSNRKMEYKIIIPKKEPLYDYGWCKNNVVLLQETLEEIAERLLPNKNGFTNRDRFNFIEGAKWQQKRSYSEEELLNLLISKEENTKDSVKYNGVEYITPGEWFEKFKKK